MASTIFPQPSSSAAFGLSMAAANTVYHANCNLTPGVYTLSVAAGVTVTIDMFSSNSYITTQSGTTGLSFNLTQSIDRITFYSSTGSNQVANITLTATVLPITGGTVTSYTTSQTVTGLSGLGYVVCFGGGASGANYSQFTSTGRYSGFNTIGAGGAAGSIGTGRVALTSSMPLVIGSFGAGQGSGTAATSPGLAGGNTTFGGVTGAGGTGGGGGSGSSGGAGSAGAVSSPALPFTVVTAGSVGAGGGAGYNSGGAGGAGNLGTGGTGRRDINSVAATSATGLASGGGGSSGTGTSGAGTSGAVYVLQYA